VHICISYGTVFQVCGKAVVMSKRQQPDAVARMYIRWKTDPPWIEEKFINNIKGTFCISFGNLHCYKLFYCLLFKYHIWMFAKRLQATRENSVKYFVVLA